MDAITLSLIYLTVYTVPTWSHSSDICKPFWSHNLFFSKTR